jgi:hypothetical protein
MTMSPINPNSRNYKPILRAPIFNLLKDSIDVCRITIAIVTQINNTAIIQTTIVVQGNSVPTAKDSDTCKMSAINSFGRGRKPMMKKAAMIMGIMVGTGEEMEEMEETEGTEGTEGMEEMEEMREMATKKANPRNTICVAPTWRVKQAPYHISSVNI